jgi:hypothetical protein
MVRINCKSGTSRSEIDFLWQIGRRNPAAIMLEMAARACTVSQERSLSWSDRSCPGGGVTVRSSTPSPKSGWRSKILFPLCYDAGTHSVRACCMGPLEPITRATMVTCLIPFQRNEPNRHNFFTSCVGAQSQRCMIEFREQGLAERPIRQNEPNLHDSFTTGGQVSAPKPDRAHLGIEQTNPSQAADRRRDRLHLELERQDRHTPCEPKTRCNPNDCQGPAYACASAKSAILARPGNDDSEWTHRMDGICRSARFPGG